MDCLTSPTLNIVRGAWPPPSIVHWRHQSEQHVCMRLWSNIYWRLWHGGLRFDTRPPKHLILWTHERRRWEWKIEDFRFLRENNQKVAPNLGWLQILRGYASPFGASKKIWAFLPWFWDKLPSLPRPQNFRVCVSVCVCGWVGVGQINSPTHTQICSTGIETLGAGGETHP